MKRRTGARHRSPVRQRIAALTGALALLLSGAMVVGAAPDASADDNDGSVPQAPVLATDKPWHRLGLYTPAGLSPSDVEMKEPSAKAYVLENSATETHIAYRFFSTGHGPRDGGQQTFLDSLPLVADTLQPGWDTGSPLITSEQMAQAIYIMNMYGTTEALATPPAVDLPPGVDVSQFNASVVDYALGLVVPMANQRTLAADDPFGVNQLVRDTAASYVADSLTRYGPYRANPVQVNVDRETGDVSVTGIGLRRILQGDGDPFLPGFTYTATLTGGATFPDGSVTKTGLTGWDAIDLEATVSGYEKVGAEVVISDIPNSQAWSAERAHKGGKSDYNPAKIMLPEPLRMMARAEVAGEPNGGKFQPLAVSDVGKAKYIEVGGTLYDRLEVSLDTSIKPGTWLTFGEAKKIDPLVLPVQEAGGYKDTDPIPVTFVGTAYYTGTTPPEAPFPADKIDPLTMPVVASGVQITANGPGSFDTGDVPMVCGDTCKAGFVTWVWRMNVADQEPVLQQFLKADWADNYGMPDETTSVQHDGKFASTAQVTMGGGQRIITDDFVLSDFPKDHPHFEGLKDSEGNQVFGPDAETFTTSLYFYEGDGAIPKDSEPLGEPVGTPVTVTLGDNDSADGLSNGTYTGITSPDWIVKTDLSTGLEIPGTYVVVAEFEGDSRVLPVTTSVEDVMEQVHITESGYEIATMATGPGDAKLITRAKDSTITDTMTVTEGDIDPSLTYEVDVQLVETGTATVVPISVGGKPAADKVTVEWQPQKPSDTFDVDMTFDATQVAGDGVTVIEWLRIKGKPDAIAIHHDPNNPDQTVRFAPKFRIATEASDGQGAKVIERTEDASIYDLMTVDPRDVGKVVPGLTYVVKAWLVETGDLTDEVPITDGDEDGKKTVEWTPRDDKDTQLDIPMTFDATKVKGEGVTVVEQIFVKGEDQPVATHLDPDNDLQTVTFIPDDPPKIDIRTYASGTNGSKMVARAPDARISDTLSLHPDSLGKWVPNQPYEVEVGLVETGDLKKTVDITGGDSTGERIVNGKKIVEWTPLTEDASLVVPLTFDATRVEGDGVTVVERVFKKGETDPVATHLDPENGDQTVRLGPVIKTTATTPSGGKVIDRVADAAITDRLEVLGDELAPGTTYEVTAALVETGTDERVAITGSEAGEPGTDGTLAVEWTPKTTDEVLDIPMTFDATKVDGDGVTVIEWVRVKDGAADWATHLDNANAAQTVRFEDPPEGEISTTAVSTTGTKFVSRTANTVINDTVCETTGVLVPGRTYEIQAGLVEMGTDVRVPITGGAADGTVRVQWTPTAANDCFTFAIPFDATEVDGNGVTVIEWVREAGDDRVIAEHLDPDNANQTVRFSYPLARTGGSTSTSFPLARTGFDGMLAMAAGAALAAGSVLVLRRRYI